MSTIPLNYVGRALQFLRPYARLAVGSVVLTILSSLAALLVPWPLKLVVDHVLEQHPLPTALGRLGLSRLELLYAAVIGGLLVALATNLLHVLSNYINTKLDQYLTLDFRSHLFLHAQRMSLAFHDQRRSGMLIYMINSQGDAPAGLIMTIPMLAESALTLVGMFWISFHMDWELSLISLAIVPFLYYSVGYYATHIQGRLQGVRTLEAESLAVIHESLSMMRVIVSFGREEHEYRRFRQQTDSAVAARVQVTLRQTIFSMVVNMITALGSTLVLGLGAYHVIAGRLTVGQLLVVIAYIAAVYKPLETISYTIGSLQDRFISLKNTFDFLDREPDIKDKPRARTLPFSHGRITYDNVHFSYSGRTDTLKEISFEARPGQIIGLVGPTGAGKSTLVSLLPRFYDPQQGRILLDGVESHDLTLKSLRRHISIVLQEPLLFSGTIAENIRYGRLEATTDEIIAAAKAANAHDFIMRLPQRYDTLLGERGAAISGGERQRISVARAFLKNAPILILDEPTSSVDSKTEAVILEALDRLIVGRTTFIIAHRLSTLHSAELILVLNQGRLVEQGTQDQLLKQGGLYKQLHDAQTISRSAKPQSPSLITLPA
ncbi:MAG TPA: ABC transporter ATP-binding protein [Candidatus Limnocylindrales bacterium]|nr:ABC transporter ATP-binding protein [Candidatus Limnocylindrales bacterium]